MPAFDRSVQAAGNRKSTLRTRKSWNPAGLCPSGLRPLRVSARVRLAAGRVRGLRGYVTVHVLGGVAAVPTCDRAGELSARPDSELAVDLRQMRLDGTNAHVK